MAKSRTIEIDSETAEALEGVAQTRGQTLTQFLHDLSGIEAPLPSHLDALREQGRGPWSPQALAEDARAAADFERTGEGIPFDDVVAWMESWGTTRELPPPQPRKL
jgi:predicted transcriptional regulator